MRSVIGAVCPSCDGFACITFPRRGQCPQVTLSSSKIIGEADGKENLSLLGTDFKLKQIQTLRSRNLSLLPCSHELVGKNTVGPAFFSGFVGWLLQADPWSLSRSWLPALRGHNSGSRTRICLSRNSRVIKLCVYEHLKIYKKLREEGYQKGMPKRPKK